MDFQAKAAKIKELFDNFLIKLSNIQRKKLEVFKRLESQQERKKIENIEEKIKNL